MAGRDTTNYYEVFGGEPFFSDLVSQFYARVATNEILRPMYPERDMAGAARRLQMFLEQYWAGRLHILKSAAIHACVCAMQVFILGQQRGMHG